MLPKAVSDLTKEQFDYVKREMERKPSKEDLDRVERAKRAYEKYPI